MGLGQGWARPPGWADHCPPVDAAPQVQTQGVPPLRPAIGAARVPPGPRAAVWMSTWGAVLGQMGAALPWDSPVSGHMWAPAGLAWRPVLTVAAFPELGQVSRFPGPC